MKKIKFNWKEFFWINVGVILTSIGIYFFKIPNNFSSGGVSGLSIILSPLISFLTPAQLIVILNIFLLILGFIFLGKTFGVKTVYASAMFSLQTWLLEQFIPLNAPLTNEPFMELFIDVMLCSLGSAILFNYSASSGGTEIIAMILKKFTNLNVGTALLLSDSVIAISSFFVFDIQTGLFSILGLFATGYLVDGVIERINLSKYFTIITTKPDEISDFIINELHRGITRQVAQGEYTKAEKYILLTVVRRSQAVKLRNKVKQVDPDGFIMVANSSEIIGKGFRTM